MTGLTVQTGLTEDRLQPQGDPTLWYQDANLGIYRRGDFQGTNALPTVTLQVSSTGFSPANVTLTATAYTDGAIARVEFTMDPAHWRRRTSRPTPSFGKMFRLETISSSPAPWIISEVARDSSPRFLTVTGGQNKKAADSRAQISSDKVSLPDSVTCTATASDPDGAKAHVAIYDGSVGPG